ncbi:hypothetical protein BDZ89DRAFT_1127763 [Hymenopellis radicata]|nr:hypothetical protein BDZ89DRAFT_1127763 [Hymenopellis radicata]
MESRPSTLSPATIDAFLQYLIPPMQLAANPFPSPLLSLPLLQRHHFLNISPEDNLADYLTWPSAEQPQILDILHALPNPGPAEQLPIKYTGDQETLFAHVHLRFTPDALTGLRLVFQWDTPDSAWKYHNIALMPFPPNSFDNIDDMWGLQVHVVEEANEEDAYWDAYGHDDHLEVDPDATRAKHDHGNNEDAYWAQYANVHGSGDSTIPSPMPEKRKPGSYISSQLHEHSADSDDHLHHGEEIVDMSLSSLRPSKHAIDLSDRLHALSSRLHSLPAQEDVPELTEESSPETESPSEAAPFQESEVEQQPVKLSSEETEAGDDVDVLKETIRGVYRLWKMGRKGASGEAESADEFLDIVKQVLHET